MGPGCIFGDGGNVSHNGTRKRYGEDQGHGMHTMIHLEEVGGASVQAIEDRIRSNVFVGEEIAGNFHQVRSDGDTILSQTEHSKTTWYLRTLDKGG